MLRRILIAVLPALALLLAHGAQADEEEQPNGILLVARPELFDPNFRETVVLITQPVPGRGPIGVILNRPTETRLSEAWPDAGAVPEQFDRLYSGGPVGRNQLLFLARSSEPIDRGLRVLEDVYMSGDPELLKKIVAADVKVTALRAYAGYAGWAPRQLQAEVAAGGWYILRADADILFAKDPAQLWPELIRKITLRSALYTPR